MIVQVLIIFLLGILIFTLQLYIGKKWAVVLALLFVAGAGSYTWYSETYMSVENNYESLYEEHNTVVKLEVRNPANGECFEVTDKDALHSILEDFKGIKAKKSEPLVPEKYKYDLRFLVEKPAGDGDTSSDYTFMFVNDQQIGEYEIVEGEGHLETIEAVAKEGEVRLGNIYKSGTYESGTTHYLIVPFDWKGEKGSTLKSVEIVDELGEKLPASSGISSEFYIGDRYKKTGVYRRSDIGKKEHVDEYEISAKQTLIMETTLNDVTEGTASHLKFTYERNGETREKIVEWDTLRTLNTES